MFHVRDCFGFSAHTGHHAVAVYDKFLQIDDIIDKLRNSFQSCKGVVSEQICTFIASLALFISSKYCEIRYPVVTDVCKLMECPFSFQEFEEMEKVVLQVFSWNFQFPTVVEVV